MRLVLDTDVLVSGLQSARGASRLLLCGILEKAFIPLVTVPTILEAEEVLMRPECRSATGLSAADTMAFVDGYLSRSEQVFIRRRVRPSATDPNDQMFVEALVNGGGDAIVSFNLRDYLDTDARLASAGNTVVPIMTPGEVLRKLAWRPTTITPFVFPRL
jgi:predicted nucleic acid-binding protein